MFGLPFQPPIPRYYSAVEVTIDVDADALRKARRDVPDGAFHRI